MYIHWRGLKRKLKRESAYTNGTVSFLRAPPSSIDWERIPRNVDELPLRLFRTYKPYDKDTLIIIAGFRPHSQQSRFHSLLEAGIKLHPRKADLEIATPIAIGEPAPTQTDQTEPSSAEQAEVEAAGRIWAFWKKYQPQLQQKRSDAKIRAKRLLTYEGTARVIIEDILPFAYRGHRDALVNIGIPLLTEILTTQGQIESLNTKAKAQLANQALKLTVDNVERLQEIVSLFVPKAHREIQDTIAGFKIGKGAKLRKIPIEKLKRRLCHTASKHVQRLQKTVEVYEKDLGDMGGKTEAVSNGDDRP